MDIFMELIAEQKESNQEIQSLVESDHIKNFNLELDRIRKDGALVDIDICGLSLFTTTIDWGDIGIQDDTTKSRLRRSQKFLYDVGICNKLCAKAQSIRNLLNRYSKLGNMFYPYKWISISEYPMFREKFNAMRRSFYELRDQATDPDFYTSARNQVIADFTEMASMNWQSKIKSSAAKYLIYNGAACETEDAYIYAMVSEALSKMPRIEDMQHGLRVSLRFARVCAKTEMELDCLQADRIRHQRALEDARTRASEREIYLRNAKLEDEVQHQRIIHELEFEKQRMEVEKNSLQEAVVREEIARRAREQFANEITPAMEAVHSLAKSLVADLTEVLESIEKNKFLAPTVARKGEDLLNLYKFFGELSENDQILALLGDIREKIQSGQYKGRERKSIDELAEAVEAARCVAQEQACSIAQPSRFSLL